MSKEDKEETTIFFKIDCYDCGIRFAITEVVDKMWRKSNKQFYCPNGHGMSYPKPKPEIEKLNEEIKNLKEKLATALADVATQKKRVEELALEVEIWKPSEAKEVTAYEAQQKVRG